MQKVTKRNTHRLTIAKFSYAYRFTDTSLYNFQIRCYQNHMTPQQSCGVTRRICKSLMSHHMT